MNRDASRKKPKGMKLRDAAAYLGTSAAKISRLVKAGELTCMADPLDRRQKIVRVEDLDRIKEEWLKVWGEEE